MLRRKGILLRYPGFSIYEVYALLIIALAIVIRVSLVNLGWPLLDSDEGTMGLMGMHIAFRGEMPIFFYGQSYMGAAEAYLAAFMFHFFGVSVLTLRLGLILLYVLFLISMYLFTTLLFSKKWALLTLFILSLGSNALLTRELVAVGGDMETLVTGTLLLLLALWLALTGPDTTKRKRRLLAYAGWGLSAGFGFWSHMLVAPFVLMSALILLVFCRKELFNREVLRCFSWAIPILLVGFIIGVLPLIIYDVSLPDQNFLTTFWSIDRATNVAQQPPFYILFPTQLIQSLQISLPIATGSSPLCSVSDALTISFSSLHATHCTLVHTVWPAGTIILWITSVWLTLSALGSYWKRLITGRSTPEEKPFLVRNFVCLALLATSGITFALFTISPSPAFYPVATSRYLIGLLVTTPALLRPLWSGINAVKPLALHVAHVTVAVRLARISVVIRRGILVLIIASLLLATINVYTGIFVTPLVIADQDIFNTQPIDQHLNVPATRVYNQQEQALITQLLRIGATHIYSDYWTCDRLIFQTKEHIICSAIDAFNGSIVVGHNRYDPYQKIVQADAHSTYVVEDNTLLAHLMAVWASSPKRAYKIYFAGGYTIYKPFHR